MFHFVPTYLFYFKIEAKLFCKTNLNLYTSAISRDFLLKFRKWLKKLTVHKLPRAFLWEVEWNHNYQCFTLSWQQICSISWWSSTLSNAAFVQLQFHEITIEHTQCFHKKRNRFFTDFLTNQNIFFSLDWLKK